MTAISAVVALACASAASAQDSPYPEGPFAPWDGSNPFKCVIQDAGRGSVSTGPEADLDADPYCVEFDKTRQNITGFGILEFLSAEPRRLEAAGPKCFYYQTDHWTGSIDQEMGPELWHWDGQYFFDKAFGVGGVNLQNFRIGGQPASPSDYGEVPPEFAPYMDQSGGGSYLIGGFEADPDCAARVDTPEEQAQVYAGRTSQTGGSPPADGSPTAGGSAPPPAGSVPFPAKRGAKPKRKCKRAEKKKGGKRSASSARKKGCKRKGKRKRRR